MSTPGSNSKPSYILDIPQELLNAIIDLNKDNTKSLLNCALVSRRFTTRCQEHIFSKVLIDASNGPRVATQLQYAFTMSPHLADFVHTLRLVGNRYGSARFANGIEYSDLEHTWLFASKPMITVLSQLVHVRYFQLAGDSICLRWGDFPEDLQVAFETFIKRGGLEDMILHWVVDFPCRFLAIPSLTRLNAMFTTLKTELCVAASSVFEPGSVLPSKPSRLTYLYLHSDLQFFSFIPFLLSPNSGVDVSSLLQLTIRPRAGFVNPRDVQGLADWWDPTMELVKRASQSLRDLWISPVHVLEDCTVTTRAPDLFKVAFASLGILPQLRCLNIDIRKGWIAMDVRDQPLSYGWCLDLLSNIHQGQLPQLSTINVLCTFCIEANRTEFPDIDRLLWRNLDGVLSKIAFVTLKRVNILVLLSCSETVDPILEPMTDMMRQEMGTMRERGVLHVAVLPRDKVEVIPHNIHPTLASQLIK